MTMGITVEGKPLKEFLQTEEDQEFKENIVETLKEFAGLKKSIYKTPLPTKPKSYYPHSRTKKFTTTEIRKEYGIMNKPFKSFPEEVLFHLSTNKPIRTSDLAKLTKKGTGHVSGTLHQLHRILPDFVFKNPDGKWSMIGVDPDKVFNEYNQAKGKKKKKPEVKPETETVEVKFLDVAKALKEATQESLGKDLNIKITVRVLFGFDKGE
jgi:hypothetical protein